MVNHGASATTHVLVLGGSSEASRLAEALAAAGVRATFSYAGRVKRLKPQPLPTRVGGFGGVVGLVKYVRDVGITHIVDATHPFAAQMSRHVALACRETNTPHVTLARPPWQPGVGDAWLDVPTMQDAVEVLGEAPRRVFLAIGRQHVDLFVSKPQHFFLLRFVEPPGAEIRLAKHALVIARGPFEVADEVALMRRHGVEVVVSKNAGGAAARAKLEAAKVLGLPVVMVRRPEARGGLLRSSVAEVLAWLRHAGVNPGV